MKLILAILFCFYGDLQAGEIFRLAVEINQNGKTSNEEQHTWYLDKREFRLKIDGKGRTVDYIFTGRSLLACLKVSDANAIQSVSIHKDLQKALGSGLCIVAPINIMTSFFISPFHSLSFVKTDESMKSTLQLQKSTYSDFPFKDKVEVPCQGKKREFEFTFEVDGGDPLLITGKEEACYAKFNWRESIWREISRRLLQQPKAKDLRGKLQEKDLQNLGVLVGGNLEISQKESKDQKANVLKLKVSLKKHEITEIHKRYFQKPNSYQMVSTFQSAQNVLVNLKSDGKDDGNSISIQQIFKLFMFPVIP